MMKVKAIVAALGLGAAISAPALVQASTETATLDVSLNNLASVSVQTIPIVFGDVAASEANPLGTGAITVNATNNLVYNIAIDGGLNAQSLGACRRMEESGGPGGRRYDLYSDFTYSVQWGDSDFGNTCAGANGDGGASKAGVGTGSDEVHSVYAKAYNGTTPGLMTDTVTVTVHY